MTFAAARRTTVPATRHDVLGAQLVRPRVRLGRGLGVEDELQQAGAVAQVDEDQAAVVAAAVHPAGHADLVARRGLRVGSPHQVSR